MNSHEHPSLSMHPERFPGICFFFYDIKGRYGSYSGVLGGDGAIRRLSDHHAVYQPGPDEFVMIGEDLSVPSRNVLEKKREPARVIEWVSPIDSKPGPTAVIVEYPSQ